jgi:DNA-binding IclR family transcriptional regulator
LVVSRQSAVQGLTEIAVTGFAANRGETEPDDSGVASPILIGDQVAAVPTARIMDRLDEIAVATRDAAREISERIRGRENQLQQS